eukprot:SAG11_NODE_26489_length_344_cov_1.240816_1_plen_53_part_01
MLLILQLFLLLLFRIQLITVFVERDVAPTLAHGLKLRKQKLNSFQLNTCLSIS